MCSRCARVAVPAQIARDKLVALGTCIGKLTHTGKFRLTIGALDILSQHAKYKVRPNAMRAHTRTRITGHQTHSHTDTPDDDKHT